MAEESRQEHLDTDVPAAASPKDGAGGWFQPHGNRSAAGDLVLLVTSDQKRYLIQLRPGRTLHTHLGIFDHDELLDVLLGAVVTSRLGHQALVLEPSLGDLIRHIKRGTQIIYPKDAAYLVHRLNLRAGSRVVEAGTGSAGLTIALAWSVAPGGRVYTYEARPENHQLARRNLERVGLLDYVEMIPRAIGDGFDQHDVDALFLDVREPWRHLDAVRASLKSGGFFASLVPTVNQVTELIAGLERHAFADVAVEELLLRRYKAVPERLRPEDDMVAHTGFLIFARPVAADVDPDFWMSKERRRYQSRTDAQERIAAEEARRADERAQGGRKYPRLPLP